MFSERGIAEGLSPRVRGSRVGPERDAGAGGSIPACAGEPRHGLPAAVDHRVYPRVCGGAPLRPGSLVGCAGLSPRVRGSRAGVDAVLPGQGSIPACAGEPGWQMAWWRPVRVYPRVCGGAVGRGPDQRHGEGLSPRVRGSPGGADHHSGRDGSIPACAGEPESGKRPTPRTRVYPRVCGGAGSNVEQKPNGTGLSPRVRGSRTRGRSTGTDKGSIPACAGEPWTWWRTTR